MASGNEDCPATTNRGSGGTSGFSRPSGGFGTTSLFGQMGTPMWKPEKYPSRDFKDFDSWRRHFEVVMDANNYDAQQIRRLIPACLTGSALEEYSALSEFVRHGDVQALLDTLSRALSPYTTPSIQRHEFNQSAQAVEEDIRSWARRVRKLARKTYVDLREDEQDRLAQDQFISGLCNEELQELMYREEFHTLEDAVNRALRVDAATKMSKNRLRKRGAQVRMARQDSNEELADPVRWTATVDKDATKKVEVKQDALAEQMKLVTETLVGLKKQLADMAVQQPTARQGGFIPKLFDPYKGERRSFNRGNGQTSSGCFKCGAPDHWAKQCPKNVAGSAPQNHLN